MSDKNKAKNTQKTVPVKRVFTKKGVHPYDEVEWELRDVVQQNWKTGEVVFEQLGVEYPKNWSLNASTIVTTKYFRGEMGTERRETSLKQVIDRVAKTYAQAGFDNGYFGDEKDVEVFEHELTWMLLNQVFSFNSPVWFNVGTKSPQQVSACFILGVEDSMDSILNWYREEGFIFKGGSGAGINLSSLRSSKEVLSNGGMASGPVSFMRGADASAGTIKSGGATRRAAKMVVLDVDHPDIKEFVETKAREEDKIRALRDAGFDMDLGGKDIISVQYQNANNSVRVDDEFMNAVETGDKYGLRARSDGRIVEEVDSKDLFRQIAEAAWACADPGIQYKDTINDWHTNPVTGPITASNPCSEFLSGDNTSCNLASLNLLKFLKDDNTFDTVLFTKAVELIFTAMDISICFADFPTEKITENTRNFRQLGIGYANLGALLMAMGKGYDTEEGFSTAAAITSLMTGVSYRRSAEMAAVVGPYNGYELNKDAHLNVMKKHDDANNSLRVLADDQNIHDAANKEWAKVIKLGEKNGFRNAQASLLAPTGCLTGETLISTERGLLRLSELGEVFGEQWQDLGIKVSTDEGPKTATKFFINGEELTRKITTKGGFGIQGTLTHRVKVLDLETGDWNWKRMADVVEGDIIPMQLGTMIGKPVNVALPILEESYSYRARNVFVPEEMNEELAELLGYFIGDGSLHAKGIRLCVANTDLDVANRLEELIFNQFGIKAVRVPQEGYLSVEASSVPLSRWWKAAGFAKHLPTPDHSGKGWTAHIPTAVRETNSTEIYKAFIRGLFEADGTVGNGISVSTANEGFAGDIRTLLLALGFVTTTRRTVSGLGGPITVVRMRNMDYAKRYAEEIGFISERKSNLADEFEPTVVGKGDRVYLSRKVWEEIVPVSSEHRANVLSSLNKYGTGISRTLAVKVYESTGDERIGSALEYIFEPVKSNEDGGLQPTYDLSVPENVTYVANGMVSHNTIGFMMDCDTTGIEPDFSLVKFKKMVGGGSLQIVNQTIPRALRKLGYSDTENTEIVAFIGENGHVVDAPHLKKEHYAVFDTAMGRRSIEPMGHVRMMAAVQPFLSGAISKTVNMPETATVEEIEDVYMQGWKLGLKALAVYRDNCKVGQPLSDGKAEKKETPAEILEAAAEEQVRVEYRAKRSRLPRTRKGQTTSFTVAGSEGYVTSSEYEDGRIGEIFVKLGKQGSTLAGVMDAFSIALSIGLQYGVPLETFVAKFANQKFEPAGMTDDPDVRIAQSFVDYIFRRLALDYMPFDDRADLGIFTAAERAQYLETGSYEIQKDDEVEETKESSVTSKIIANAKAVANKEAPEVASVTVVKEEVGSAHTSAELLEKMMGSAVDAPLCLTCGTKMRPSGSCYVCEGCGSTSGCS